jgi:hypothetical protein
MREQMERILRALAEVRDSESGTRHVGEPDEDPESPVPNPDDVLRAVLQEELASEEVDAGRVLQALADWLEARNWGLETRDPEAPDSECRVASPELAGVQEQVRGLRREIREAARRQRLAENRLRLDHKLAASRLPKPLAALVASRFNPDGPLGGRDITEEEVEMEIQRVREAYAALSPVGRVVETGRVKVVREPQEKLQMALDRLFNLPVEDSSIPTPATAT